MLVPAIAVGAVGVPVSVGDSEVAASVIPYSDKVVGLVYQSLAVPKDVLDRLHGNTSYIKLLNRTE